MVTSGMSGMHGQGGPEAAMQDMSRQAEMQELIDTTLKAYEGDMDILEKALGMLVLGDYVGWRVLVLVHSKSTLRRYEQILGIKVREFFPEEGPLSRHSEGYNRALELRRYWKVANGDIAVEHRRSLRPPPRPESDPALPSEGGEFRH